MYQLTIFTALLSSLLSLFPSSTLALGVVGNTSVNSLIASDGKTAALTNGLQFGNNYMSLYTLAVTQYAAASDITIALWMSNWQETAKNQETAYSQPPTLCNYTYVGGLSVDDTYRSCSRNVSGDAYIWGISKVWDNGKNFELTLTHQLQFTGKNFTLFFSAYYNVTSDMLGKCNPNSNLQPLDTPPPKSSQGPSCTSGLTIKGSNTTQQSSSVDIPILDVYYTIP